MSSEQSTERDPLLSLTRAELVAKMRTADAMYRSADQGLREFVEWVATYETERQLVGSGVIDKAKRVLIRQGER